MGSHRLIVEMKLTINTMRTKHAVTVSGKKYRLTIERATSAQP